MQRNPSPLLAELLDLEAVEALLEAQGVVLGAELSLLDARAGSSLADRRAPGPSATPSA